MKDSVLQLLLYTEEERAPGRKNRRGLQGGYQWRLAKAYPGIRLVSHRPASGNGEAYAWLNLILDSSQPRNVDTTQWLDIECRTDSAAPWKKVVHYPLHSRAKGETHGLKGVGLSPQDLVYLVMPDRFVNGNSGNDVVQGMRESTVNRRLDVARHGGDLKGIEQRLDYLQGLGVTALWLNPVLENDVPKESYHGYAATDLYRVDSRLGNHQEYRQLVRACASKGIKVIMDIVHNHWGITHPLLANPVDSGWINRWPTFTRSNYRAITRMDPYAQQEDRDLMRKGWFDHPMPDLNQSNPDLERYMIQNNCWWVEWAGIAGYRIDTYAYPDTRFMRRWTAAMQREYPSVALVGEVWVHTVPESAYWTEDCPLFREDDSVRLAGPGLPSVTDFPLRIAMIEALNEKFDWDHGLRRIYYVLSQDFLYKDPSRNLIFLDNHDVSRAWSEYREDFAKIKLAYKMLYTLRGIPQLYYGSEILFGNFAALGGTNVRQDMPGGWVGDSISVFDQHGLSASAQSMLDELRQLGRWRKGSEVIGRGRFEHFVPEGEVYVYFRSLEKPLGQGLPDKVMVLVNGSNTPQTIGRERYARHWPLGVTATEQPWGKKVTLGESIDLPAMSCTILEWSWKPE
jgi:glycosidase